MSTTAQQALRLARRRGGAARPVPAVRCRRRTFAPECVVVQPDEIPFPQDQLLVHHDHMTEVLAEAPRRRRSRCTCWRSTSTATVYTRKISLTPPASRTRSSSGGSSGSTSGTWPRGARRDPGQAVAAGRDPDQARRAPADQAAVVPPLPRRRPGAGLFGDPTRRRRLYGRIGTIYCNDEPAIEVLEIVVNCGRSGRQCE